MHRVFLFIMSLTICTSFSSAQTLKPKKVQFAEEFTEQQVILTKIFLETLLKYVDVKTRDSYADSTDPLCLPQRPVIKMSYKGREIADPQFTEFMITARREAPSVQLVGPKDNTSEAYIIDILEVENGEPLSSVKYRHSQDLTFPSWESQPWFGSTNVPKVRKRGSDTITSEALILVSTFKAISLSLGHFPTDLLEEDMVEVKNQLVLDEIGKVITTFHEKTSTQVPKASGFLPYSSAYIQKLDKRIDDKDIKVAFATRSFSSGFVGIDYTYLLVKNEGGWDVIDASARSFSDAILNWSCKMR